MCNTQQCSIFVYQLKTTNIQPFRSTVNRQYMDNTGHELFLSKEEYEALSKELQALYEENYVKDFHSLYHEVLPNDPDYVLIEEG